MIYYIELSNQYYVLNMDLINNNNKEDGDLLADLENDLGFDDLSDDNSDNQQKSDKEEITEGFQDEVLIANKNSKVDDDKIIEQISRLVSDDRNLSTKDLLSRLNMKSVKNISSISKLLSLVDPVINQINEMKSGSNGMTHNEEYEFLVTVNEFTQEIQNEILLIHQFVKKKYNPIFSELESIVPDPVEYSKVILILGFENVSSANGREKLQHIISRDKILVINMSILELPDNLQSILDKSEFESIKEACDFIIELNDARYKMMGFVSERLSLFAPNLSKLAGSFCAVQLISYAGGLQGLSTTPACNISSIGNKRPIKVGFGQVGIQQKGYLYQMLLIESTPESVKKQVMRIVAAKIVLAARMDLAGSYSDGSFGEKMLTEINKKIEKLLEPPENSGIKALPVPVDKPSKKRGGKRFRKMKERYQLSEMQKAQNRMEFGKQEDSIMNSFGEEIGLGMTGKNSLTSSGQIRLIRSTDINRKTKLSKANQKRL